MVDISPIVAEINALAEASGMITIGVAGPAGVGKSTFAERLRSEIGPRAIAIGMDGFHYDNALLQDFGLMNRKGAPQTFDFEGLRVMLERISQGGEVAVPTFDRDNDLSRAGSVLVTRGTPIRIVEGNYLLLKTSPWNQLARYFDMTIFLNVPKDELLSRLVQRWLDQGLSKTKALERAINNDMANVEYILENSRSADFTIDPR